MKQHNASIYSNCFIKRSHCTLPWGKLCISLILLTLRSNRLPSCLWLIHCAGVSLSRSWYMHRCNSIAHLTFSEPILHSLGINADSKFGLWLASSNYPNVIWSLHSTFFLYIICWGWEKVAVWMSKDMNSLPKWMDCLDMSHAIFVNGTQV